MPWAPPRLPERVTRQGWRKGILTWKLHPVQRLMRERFYAQTLDETVWNCARRLGKTFALVVLGFEQCLRKAGSRVAFGASQASDIEEIIEPMVDELLEDCPRELRPRLRWGKHRIEFPHNGSVIKISGCDKGRYKYLRGRAVDLWIVDEGAFIDELEKIVDSVLSPQTWTTKGRGILASTPPETPGHHFQTRYLIAKQNGASERYTIDDNPLIGAEEKLRIIEKHAKRKGLTIAEFLKSTTYLREYCAEFVTEMERAIVPEFTETREEKLRRSAETETRELWVDRYTSVDVGPTRDWTAILCGYWSFDRKRLVFVGERRLIRPNRRELARAVKELELECFGPSNGMPGTQHFRFIDGNEILTRDLALEDGLHFVQTAKDKKDEALVDFRSWVADDRMEIYDTLKMLPTHLRAGIWNKAHTEYERIEGFGHFDFIDAALYMQRNVIPNMNRLPPRFGIHSQDQFVSPRAAQDDQDARLLLSLAGLQ